VKKYPSSKGFNSPPDFFYIFFLPSLSIIFSLDLVLLLSFILAHVFALWTLKEGIHESKQAMHPLQVPFPVNLLKTKEAMEQHDPATVHQLIAHAFGGHHD